MTLDIFHGADSRGLCIYSVHCSQNDGYSPGWWKTEIPRRGQLGRATGYQDPSPAAVLGHAITVAKGAGGECPQVTDVS